MPHQTTVARNTVARTALGITLGLTLTVTTVLAVLTARGLPSAAGTLPHVTHVQVSTTTGCEAGVPDPGTTDPVDICWSMFQPAGATALAPVPMVMQSHGWGGSRTLDPTWLAPLLDAGYGVLSFDQRGFGDSGGKAQVQNPDVEGRDVDALVSLVARQSWVLQDAEGDPRLGAIGGSYGGGFQLLGAFTSRLHGKSVFDALAPEYTWNDLEESLAPNGVVRTQWTAFLAASALPSQALPPSVYKAFVESAALGRFPDGSPPGTEDLHSFLERNGTRWQVESGRRLDVPVLLGQGLTDTLFDVRQALSTWHAALTPGARSRSIMIGYDGGHTIPAVTGLGPAVAADPCSAALVGDEQTGVDFLALTVRFFDEQLKGEQTGLGGYGRIHLATPGGRCVSIDDDRPTTPYPVSTVVTPTVAGVALGTRIADGPISIAGSPTVTATVSTLGPDARVFYGLAVGTSPSNATLVQDNVLPLRVPNPVAGRLWTFDLPTVAVDVPAGQSLYLLASPVNPVFAGSSSRTPGRIVLRDAVVNLPVVRP